MAGHNGIVAPIALFLQLQYRYNYVVTSIALSVLLELSMERLDSLLSGGGEPLLHE